MFGFKKLLFILFLFTSNGYSQNPLVVNGIAGIQLFNPYDAKIKDAAPAVSFLFLVPHKRWTFQQQNFIDKKGKMYWRIAVDYQIFRKKIR